MEYGYNAKYGFKYLKSVSILACKLAEANQGPTEGPLYVRSKHGFLYFRSAGRVAEELSKAAERLNQHIGA